VALVAVLVGNGVVDFRGKRGKQILYFGITKIS
jgi:hypothetical protein